MPQTKRFTPHNNSMYGRPKAGAFGLCRWRGPCFLSPPLLARNAGAVMLQAGRHRASTHEGVEVIAFSCMHFRRPRQLHSYWHAAHPTLRPLPPHRIIFAQALRAPAFGGFVPICNKRCHIQGPTRSRRRLFRCTANTREVFQELFA